MNLPATNCHTLDPDGISLPSTQVAAPSESATESSLPVQSGRRIRVRRFGIIALILCCLGILGIAWNRDQPWVRTTLLNLCAWAYTCYDPSEEAVVSVGPTPSATTTIEPAQQLRSELSWPVASGELTVRLLTAAKEVPSPVSFYPESLASPKLNAFRAMAAPILAEGQDLFQLSNALRSRVEHGVDFEEAAYNQPQELLELGFAGKKLTCRHFAIVYCGLATLQGYTARVLGLSRTGKNFDHAVVEVYSPEHGKWILIDPDFNVAFRRRGVWLHAGELQQIWFQLLEDTARELHTNDRTTIYGHIASSREQIQANLGLEVVPLGPAGEQLRASNYRAQGPTGMGLSNFTYIYYGARNNYLTAQYPFAHPKRVHQFVLMPQNVNGFAPLAPEAVLVESWDMVYWNVGAISLAISNPSVGGGLASLIFTISSFTPNFEHVEITDASGKHWVETSDQFKWSAPAGIHELEFRTVNTVGIKGEPTRIRIEIPSMLNRESKK